MIDLQYVILTINTIVCFFVNTFTARKNMYSNISEGKIRNNNVHGTAVNWTLNVWPLRSYD